MSVEGREGGSFHAVPVVPRDDLARLQFQLAEARDLILVALAEVEHLRRRAP